MSDSNDVVVERNILILTQNVKNVIKILNGLHILSKATTGQEVNRDGFPSARPKIDYACGNSKYPVFVIELPFGHNNISYIRCNITLYNEIDTHNIENHISRLEQDNTNYTNIMYIYDGSDPRSQSKDHDYIKQLIGYFNEDVLDSLILCQCNSVQQTELEIKYEDFQLVSQEKIIDDLIKNGDSEEDKKKGYTIYRLQQEDNKEKLQITLKSITEISHKTNQRQLDIFCKIINDYIERGRKLDLKDSPMSIKARLNNIGSLLLHREIKIKDGTLNIPNNQILTTKIS